MRKVYVDNLKDGDMLHKFYGLSKEGYEAGEQVEFFVITGTDTNYKVTSAQASISADVINPGGQSYYSFIMPDCDVEINISTSGSMMNTGNGGTSLDMNCRPVMGMFGGPVNR